jgi:hypothetical protein
MPAIAIQSYGRYGDSQKATGIKAVQKLIRARVDELCEEQFARPDYEHCRVSVCNSADWFIEVSMRGTAVLGRHDSAEPERYLHGVPKEELVELFLQLARGEMEAALARPWVTDRKALTGRDDFYLLANSLSLTPLHRASAKGDLDWVEAELDAGADVNAPDRFGATPLHRAALAGHADVCRHLLAAGADPTATDRDRALPHEYAALCDESTSQAVARKLVKMLESAAKGKPGRSKRD